MSIRGRGPVGRAAWRVAVATGVVSAALAVGLGGSAGAGPKGHTPVPSGVGFVYATFDQTQNVVLLIGGAAEDFCDDVGPGGDAFADAEPGMTTSRLFFRSDGSVDVKVNDKDQPIHLYEADEPPPFWLADFCDAHFADEPTPEPFASGVADLKVRVSEGTDGVIDVFNSVNGKAATPDGTTYKVRASADLVVENGVPQGDPEDFVSLDLHEIGR